MNLQGIAEIVIAVPTAIALIAAAFRFAVRLGLIYKEVTPNGGSSLKDRVMKLEVSQDIQSRTLKKQDETLEDQTRRLDRIEKMLKRLPCDQGCHKKHED